MFNENEVRYRTFKVYDGGKERKYDNGDILIYKTLLGRVVAVTVPVDETKKKFYVDFAFCSTKDNFNKDVGKDIAITRLMNKIENDEDVFVIEKTFDISITDDIRDIIVNEFSDVITWLRNVRTEDIR